MSETRPMPEMAELAPVVDWTEVTLTHRCNMRCFFCYEEARGNAEQPSLDDVKRLLERTREHSDQVVLCGREVLLRTDVLDIIRYGTSLGLRVIVFTNGQQLRHEGMVESLVEAGCDGVAVSFHFPDAESYERGARVAAKCFEWTLEGLRNVRDYNLAHPERPLAISTESDMFALNVGCLKEMRETLIGVLRGAPWRMRLASLLPCRTYDIGLEHVLDPLDSRRDEIAELTRTMPADIPLGFVKVPLCILPEGLEHRSLDAQYVYQGTALTFNHTEADHITLDTFSTSTGRDIRKVLRTQPYRWICRSCVVAPLCRFERCEWTVDLFHPTRDQRPRPYRPQGATTAPIDRAPIPRRDASLAQVLEPLGGDAERIANVELISALLAAESFPEEEILRQVLDAQTDQLRVVDVWSEDDAVLALDLIVDHEPVCIRLGVPGEPRRALPIGLPIGYLDVAPLRCEPSESALRACLALLETVMLPEVGRWADDNWFDPLGAWLMQDICEHFGEQIWPDLGGLGEWAVTEITLVDGPSIELALSHPSGPTGALAYTLVRTETESGAPGRIVLDLTLATAAGDGHLDPEICRPLLHRLGEGLTGQADGAEAAPAFIDADGTLAAQFDGGRWQAGRAAARARSGRVGSPVEALRVEIADKGDPTNTYCFFIAEHDPEQRSFEQVGDVAIWYAHDDMDAASRACIDAMLLVIKPLQTRPPTPATVDFWRGAIEKAAIHCGLTELYDWTITWG